MCLTRAWQERGAVWGKGVAGGEPQVFPGAGGGQRSGEARAAVGRRGRGPGLGLCAAPAAPGPERGPERGPGSPGSRCAGTEGRHALGSGPVFVATVFLSDV